MLHRRRTFYILKDHIIISKVTAILMNRWTLHIVEVALGRVSKQLAKQGGFVAVKLKKTC